MHKESHSVLCFEHALYLLSALVEMLIQKVVGVNVLALPRTLHGLLMHL